MPKAFLLRRDSDPEITVDSGFSNAVSNEEEGQNIKHAGVMSLATPDKGMNYFVAV